MDLVLLCFVVGTALYLASPATWWADDPRYVFPFFAVVPLAVVAALPARAAVKHALVMVLFVFVAATGATGAVRMLDYGGEGGSVGTVRTYESDARAVVQALEDVGAEAAYADYWFATILEFAAGDRIEIAPTYTVRFPSVNEAVGQKRAPAFVAASGEQAETLMRAIAAAGSSSRSLIVDEWVVIYGVDPPLYVTTPDPDMTKLGLRSR